MPEGINPRPLRQALRRLTLPRHREPHRGKQNADGEVPRPLDHPEQDALLERELSPGLVNRGRGGSGNCAHELIVAAAHTGNLGRRSPRPCDALRTYKLFCPNQNPTRVPHTEQAAPETRRLTANEIFDAATENARSELKRPLLGLLFSGLAGGTTLGLTGIGVASIRAALGNGGWQELVAYLIYPIGFIAVIIGRQQLFTENTLYPVVLVLDERKHVLSTLRLWAVVFASNIAGAILFAALCVYTSALKPEIQAKLVELGAQAAPGSFGHLFWSGVVGGWLIALVAWMVTASHWTIGQVAMIWLLTFIVGVGHFAHCIVTSCEILSSVMAGSVSTPAYLHWLLAATLGNIAGGVGIVSVLNYGQVRQE